MVPISSPFQEIEEWEMGLGGGRGILVIAYPLHNFKDSHALSLINKVIPSLRNLLIQPLKQPLRFVGTQTKSHRNRKMPKNTQDENLNFAYR